MARPTYREPRSVLAPITEAEIVAAYTAPSLEARPCVCGSVVIADPRDPTEGVRLHQAEAPHRDWLVRNGL